MLVKLVVAVVVAVAVYVAFKLWRSGKAVTAGSVASGVESEVKAAADAVKSKVDGK